MNEISSSPRGPGPAKGFLRQYGAYMIGGALVVGIVAVPLEAVVSNNRAEYEATGDVGALLGHPFDSSAHSAFKAPRYAALIAQHPDWRLSPDDAPEVRAKKISLINTDTLNRLDAERQAATIVQTAKITATEQAKADVDVSGPAYANAMDEIMKSQNQARKFVVPVIFTRSYNTNLPIRMQTLDYVASVDIQGGLPIPQNWKVLKDNAPLGYISVQEDNELTEALTNPAYTFTSGTKTITPFIYESSVKSPQAAWTTNAQGQKMVAVKVEDGAGSPKYGFISARDYETLGGPPLGPSFVYKPDQ